MQSCLNGVIMNRETKNWAPSEMQKKFMQRAIGLSLEHMRAGKGGPFGAVVVKDGELVAEGFNQVTSTNDPTAHAEMVAIRRACEKLGAFQLSGCEIYTSCEPCPMCLAAIYWARPKAVYFANAKRDAAKIGFDDEYIYDELVKKHGGRTIPMFQLLRSEALAAFDEWDKKADKILY